jgi:hypothetical protein
MQACKLSDGSEFRKGAKKLTLSGSALVSSTGWKMIPNSFPAAGSELPWCRWMYSVIQRLAGWPREYPVQGFFQTWVEE